MPVKKRKSEMRAHLFTPEVFAAFDAGDKYALARAEAPAMARIAAGYGPRWTGSIWSRDMLGIVAARRSGEFGGRYSRC